MSNGTSSALNSEQDLASIPMAQGGLTRLAIARLKSAGVPVAPLLKRVGLTPELIAEPEERLSVRSQIAFLDEAAKALKDDCIGFTLARDFDPREIGLLYYVMASSQTLGDALKRVARYSKITNEALVFGYREGNRLIINLSYSGVPRHSDRHQFEFCMFAVLRICRVLTGHDLVPQHFSISHYRSEGTSEMSRFVGTKVEFGADTDAFALNLDARELPLVRSDTYLNDLLLKYCEAALADRRGEVSQLRTRVENAISSMLPHGRVLAEDVARNMGVSERTLARKLAEEGLNFTENANPHWKDLAAANEVLLIFQGPEAYITPNWYLSKAEHGKVVPTWNYAVVHAYGRPEKIEDKAWLRRHVSDLTAQQEKSEATPWALSDAPESYIEAMLRGIVGFRIAVARLEGKWKMSQNREMRDRQGVVTGLDRRGEGDDREIAGLVSQHVTPGR